MDVERCSWCGVDVGPAEGYRVAEPAGERRAVFCRLEHVVPWAMRGAHWEPGTVRLPEGEAGASVCAECGRELDDRRVLVLRHRGEHRILDAFCGVEHFAAWARAGGRWR